MPSPLSACIATNTVRARGTAVVARTDHAARAFGCSLATARTASTHNLLRRAAGGPRDAEYPIQETTDDPRERHRRVEASAHEPWRQGLRAALHPGLMPAVTPMNTVEAAPSGPADRSECTRRSVNPFGACNAGGEAGSFHKLGLTEAP